MARRADGIVLSLVILICSIAAVSADPRGQVSAATTAAAEADSEAEVAAALAAADAEEDAAYGVLWQRPHSDECYKALDRVLANATAVVRGNRYAQLQETIRNLEDAHTAVRTRPGRTTTARRASAFTQGYACLSR